MRLFLLMGGLIYRVRFLILDFMYGDEIMIVTSDTKSSLCSCSEVLTEAGVTGKFWRQELRTLPWLHIHHICTKNGPADGMAKRWSIFDEIERPIQGILF